MVDASTLSVLESTICQLVFAEGCQRDAGPPVPGPPPPPPPPLPPPLSDPGWGLRFSPSPNPKPSASARSSMTATTATTSLRRVQNVRGILCPARAGLRPSSRAAVRPEGASMPDKRAVSGSGKTRFQVDKKIYPRDKGDDEASQGFTSRKRTEKDAAIRRMRLWMTMATASEAYLGVAGVERGGLTRSRSWAGRLGLGLRA